MKYMDIKVIKKPVKKIVVTYIDGDRAYLIQVLDNKLGNRFWRARNVTSNQQ